jgi:hypothetical protein
LFSKTISPENQFLKGLGFLGNFLAEENAENVVLLAFLDHQTDSGSFSRHYDTLT